MELNKLISKLEEFKAKLEKINHTYNKSEFIKTFGECREFLTNEISNSFINSNFYNENKDWFRTMNIYYERSIETSEAINLLQNYRNGENVAKLIKSQFITSNFLGKSEDIKNLKLTKNKNFLMVNCGPLAETLLYINYETPIENITGIDYTYESIYIAGELFSKLGLRNTKFQYSYGEEYDYKNADIIYIPSFIDKKDEIIKQIIKTGKKDMQIIVRNSIGLGNLIYKPLRVIPPELKIINRNFSNRYEGNGEMLILERYNI